MRLSSCISLDLLYVNTLILCCVNLSLSLSLSLTGHNMLQHSSTKDTLKSTDEA